jgi:hypothetical protein
MCPNKADAFNKILLATISEVLDFSDVVLNFLELNSSFRRGEIMKNADVLSRGLRELFGDSGEIIEGIILKRVYQKLKIPNEGKKGTFTEKLNTAYKYFSVKGEMRGENRN